MPKRLLKTAWWVHHGVTGPRFRLVWMIAVTVLISWALWVLREQADQTEKIANDNRTLAASINENRINRSRALNRWLISECERQELRDEIILDILEDAVRRSDSAQARRELRNGIQRYKAIGELCAATIPPIQ